VKIRPHGALLALLIPLAACASGSDSPRWYGIDLRAAPGLAVADRVTVHPTAAFATDVFGGVEGESLKFLHLGGQLRYATGSAADAIWLGGELTYARRWTSFDDGSTSETDNGWTLAGLAGRPLLSGTLGTVHGYGAAGVNKFGGEGFYFRVGLDVQPAFLRR